jgi:hypothetical protein
VRCTVTSANLLRASSFAVIASSRPAIVHEFSTRPAWGRASCQLLQREFVLPLSSLPF